MAVVGDLFVVVAIADCEQRQNSLMATVGKLHPCSEFWIVREL
jgi:hypothetical protein